MWIRYLVAVILGSFLMFATPDLAKADVAITNIDIQSQITQLKENLTSLNQKSQTVEKETKCRIKKNKSLELAIADNKGERDKVSVEIDRVQSLVDQYSEKVEELQEELSNKRDELSSLMNTGEWKAYRYCIQAAKNNPLGGIGCAIDELISGRISETEKSVENINSEISSLNNALENEKSNLQKNQDKKNDLSNKIANLEQDSRNLYDDIKRGKELLSDLNILSLDLKKSIDQNEELQEVSIKKQESAFERKRIQRRLEEITQLNQKSRDIIEKADNFLRNNSCVN